MAPSPQQPTPQRPSAPAGADQMYDNEMPSTNQLKDILTESVQIGAAAGGIGMLVGAGAGILRSAPPTLFALFAGLQWFGLGSTYIASRGLLWHAWGGRENMSSSDLVKASGAAGGVSGMVGGMFRGPSNIIPGILFFGTLATSSTYLSERLKRGSNESEPKAKAKTGWLDSKWSPMKRLSDEEYEEKLEEKILRINAEIAIIDENIAALRASGSKSSKPSGQDSK
ncbi:hypothetical protein GGR52DRAFT_234039 [Hypoxylon sp. FL1284]|nr:hypothetical protein GGR52DRAFT_234039 [Hypoxylon sp. FL1284]